MKNVTDECSTRMEYAVTEITGQQCVRFTVSDCRGVVFGIEEGEGGKLCLAVAPGYQLKFQDMGFFEVWRED